MQFEIEEEEEGWQRQRAAPCSVAHRTDEFYTSLIAPLFFTHYSLPYISIQIQYTMPHPPLSLYGIVINDLPSPVNSMIDGNSRLGGTMQGQSFFGQSLIFLSVHCNTFIQINIEIYSVSETKAVRQLDQDTDRSKYRYLLIIDVLIHSIRCARHKPTNYQSHLSLSFSSFPFEQFKSNARWLDDSSILVQKPLAMQSERTLFRGVMIECYLYVNDDQSDSGGFFLFFFFAWIEVQEHVLSRWCKQPFLSTTTKSSFQCLTQVSDCWCVESPRRQVALYDSQQGHESDFDLAKNCAS